MVGSWVEYLVEMTAASTVVTMVVKMDVTRVGRKESR